MISLISLICAEMTVQRCDNLPWREFGVDSLANLVRMASFKGDCSLSEKDGLAVDEDASDCDEAGVELEGDSAAELVEEASPPSSDWSMATMDPEEAGDGEGHKYRQQPGCIGPTRPAGIGQPLFALGILEGQIRPLLYILRT